MSFFVCLFFKAVAFPDASAKVISDESQNVNCLLLECLAFTIRKYRDLLKETVFSPSTIAFNCEPYLFSSSSACYESFVDLQYEREAANVSWIINNSPD